MTCSDPVAPNPASRRSLLELLARTGHVRRSGECLLTLSLAHLAHGTRAAEAFAGLVGDRLGVTTPIPTAWRAEPVHPDRGRPDIDGLLDGVVRFKVEAKLGEEISRAVLSSYARALAAGLAPGQSGFLLLIVPEKRVSEADGALAELAVGPVGRGWRLQRDLLAVVVPWERLIWSLSKATAGSDEAALVGEFAGFYRGLIGVPIDEFGVAALTSDWVAHRADIVAVTKEASDRWFTSRRNPFKAHRRGYEHRQISRVPGGDPRRPHFYLGVLQPDVSVPVPERPTPVWLFFHHQTGTFTDIRRNLDRSLFGPTVVPDTEGNLWLPVFIPDGVSGDDAVEALVAQAETIDDVARGVGEFPSFERFCGDSDVAFPERRVLIDRSSECVVLADGPGGAALLVDGVVEVYPTAAQRWVAACARGFVSRARLAFDEDKSA